MKMTAFLASFLIATQTFAAQFDNEVQCFRDIARFASKQQAAHFKSHDGLNGIPDAIFFTATIGKKQGIVRVTPDDIEQFEFPSNSPEKLSFDESGVAEVLVKSPQMLRSKLLLVNRRGEIIPPNESLAPRKEQKTLNRLKSLGSVIGSEAKDALNEDLKKSIQSVPGKLFGEYHQINQGFSKNDEEKKALLEDLEKAREALEECKKKVNEAVQPAIIEALTKLENVKKQIKPPTPPAPKKTTTEAPGKQ